MGDIDRLCDFKSLKKSRRKLNMSDSDSEEEDDAQNKKESRKRAKKEKKAQAGLGDMSSDTDGEHLSEKEDSEEDVRTDRFKTQNELAKAAVLATSSEEDAADASSDEEVKSP